MVSSYVDDLMNQPDALQATLDGLADSAPLLSIAHQVRHSQIRRILLTGMGSSFYALHPLALRLAALGLCVQMLETSELIHYWPALISPGTLIVAVSQSGESAEIIGLLDRAEKRATVIGVTNSPGSSLARRSDVAVLTYAGDEATVSCKTYLATLAALCWLGDELAAETPAQFSQLSSGPQLVASYLEKRDGYVEQLVQRLKLVRHMFLVGRGDSLAVAGTGGLIIKEAAHFPAEGMSCAAFRHGPFEMVSRQGYVLVFAGSHETADLNAQLAADIQSAGGQADLIGESSAVELFRLPPSPGAMRPILEILPVQMFTLALAARQGIEPGQFSKARKVTRFE